MKKQYFRCRTAQCNAETLSTLPKSNDFQMEVVRCSKCKRLIVFSTLYKPVLYRVNVPVWQNGLLES